MAAQCLQRLVKQAIARNLHLYHPSTTSWVLSERTTGRSMTLCVLSRRSSDEIRVPVVRTQMSAVQSGILTLGPGTLTLVGRTHPGNDSVSLLISLTHLSDVMIAFCWVLLIDTDLLRIGNQDVTVVLRKALDYFGRCSNELKYSLAGYRFVIELTCFAPRDQMAVYEEYKYYQTTKNQSLVT